MMRGFLIFTWEYKKQSVIQFGNPLPYQCNFLSYITSTKASSKIQ